MAAVTESVEQQNLNSDRRADWEAGAREVEADARLRSEVSSQRLRAER